MSIESAGALIGPYPQIARRQPPSRWMESAPITRVFTDASEFAARTALAHRVSVEAHRTPSLFRVSPDLPGRIGAEYFSHGQRHHASARTPLES